MSPSISDLTADRPASPKRVYRLRGRVDAADRSFLLSSRDERIGSSDVNDLVVPVTGVSRRHARLVRTPEAPEALELRDLGSRNGTFVNGRPVERAVVHTGDVIRLGPVELCLEEIDAGDAELGVVVADPWVDGASPIEESTAFVDGSGTGERPAVAADLVLPADCVLGRSEAMTRFYESLRPLLTADLPVLIEGETGVGKESVARMLHLSSRRGRGPFVAVNCAAIPGELLEAEMFGIGTGVATGVRERRGRFRDAQGGTLFLDEIGEMPLKLQAKLLRVLQEKEVQPVGESPAPVDVRVLAATNIDLLGQVEADRFRRDLYYRVAGFVLRVPPLRERVDDIPLLVEHFLHHAAAETSKPIRGMTVNALEALQRYTWPGNVRELEHEVRRLAHLCAAGQAVESTMLSERLRLSEPAPDPQRPAPHGDSGTASSFRLADHVRRAERRAIVQALVRADGSQRKAARILGIARNTLARKIRQLGIRA